MTTLLLDPTLRRARIAGATVAGLFAIFAAVVIVCATDLCSPARPDCRATPLQTAGGSSSRQPAAGSCPAAGRRNLSGSDANNIEWTTGAASPNDFLLPELTVFVDPTVQGAAESLKRHATQITTVALLGLQLDEDGAVSDHVARNLLRLAHDEGLRTMVVLQNLDRDHGQRLPERVRALARDRASRARLAEQLVRLCEAERLQGVHFSFDGLRDWHDLEPIALDVGRRLRRAQLDFLMDVPPGIDGDTLRSIAQHTSGIVVMAFDEYDAGSPAGPVASHTFVESALRSASARVPAAKLTAGLAVHGYDWVPGAPGRRISFGQAHTLARDAQTELRRNDDELHARFTSGELLHELWVADATSIERQAGIARAVGIRSLALSMLGGEDSDIWRVLREGRASVDPTRVRVSTPGIAHVTAAAQGESAELDGAGPSRDAPAPTDRASATVSSVANDLSFNATAGHSLRTPAAARVAARRPVQVRDRPSDDEHGLSLSAPFPARHTSAADLKQVALVFVDSAQVESTPAILDMLRWHHLPATFFVTGMRSLRFPQLIQRITNEGHELGSSTFTRSRIEELSDTRLHFELEVTSRLLELIIGGRPRSLRVDSAKVNYSSMHELAEAGYIVNAATMQEPLVANADADFVHQALDAADRRGVIVMPDESATAAMLGRVLPQLITQLSRRGFQLVPLSRLTGRQRDDIMPHAPARVHLRERITKVFLAATLMVSRGLPTILWLSLGLLGMRALALVTLAIAVSRRELRHEALGPLPSVTVLIPVCNAEDSIVRTVDSVLASDIPLDIVVIDDGSTDDTRQRVTRRYRREPRVRLIRQLHAGPVAARMTGLAACQTEVVIVLDGGSSLSSDAARKMVGPLRNPQVAVVSGADRVACAINALGRWQALEALLHSELEQRALSVFGVLHSAPRALNAWRRSAVFDAGGFTTTTLAPDADLTATLRDRGWLTVHADDAEALVHKPSTLRAMLRHRVESSFGVLQVLWRHRPRSARTERCQRGQLARQRSWLRWLALLIMDVLTPIATLPAFGAAGLSALSGNFAPVFQTAVFLCAVELVQLTIAASMASRRGDTPPGGLLLSFIASQVIYRPIRCAIALRSIGRLIDGLPIDWTSRRHKAAAAYAAATRAFARR